nr:hypothetical protein [Tanacetum cinerariifolium]
SYALSWKPCQGDSLNPPDHRPFTIRLRDQDDPKDDVILKGENSTKDDDEIPNEKVSQELVDEMSHTIDEAKLRKVCDEMLRQRCTSGDEHQYQIYWMQNFLKNNIMLESTKEILVSQHP